MTGSDFQLYNGVCLILSFFGCRIVWGNYQTYKLSMDAISAWTASRARECSSSASGLESIRSSIGQEPKELCVDDFPSALLCTYLVGNAVLSALNIYWFGLMLKALAKRFDKTSKPPSTSTSPRENSSSK